MRGMYTAAEAQSINGHEHHGDEIQGPRSRTPNEMRSIDKLDFYGRKNYKKQRPSPHHYNEPDATSRMSAAAIYNTGNNPLLMDNI